MQQVDTYGSIRLYLHLMVLVNLYRRCDGEACIASYDVTIRRLTSLTLGFGKIALVV